MFRSCCGVVRGWRRVVRRVFGGAMQSAREVIEPVTNIAAQARDAMMRAWVGTIVPARLVTRLPRWDRRAVVVLRRQVTVEFGKYGRSKVNDGCTCDRENRSDSNRG